MLQTRIMVICSVRYSPRFKTLESGRRRLQLERSSGLFKDGDAFRYLGVSFDLFHVVAAVIRLFSIYPAA